MACAPAVLARLGAGPFAAGHLVDVVEALVRRRQLASRGLAWLAAAFLCLHRLLAAGGAEANARLVPGAAPAEPGPSDGGGEGRVHSVELRVLCLSTVV